MESQENEPSLTNADISGEGAGVMPEATVPWGDIRRWILVCLCFLFAVALFSFFLAFIVYSQKTRVYLPVGTISKEAAQDADWDAMIPGLLLILPAVAAIPIIVICLFAWCLAFLYIRKKKRYYAVLVVIPCFTLIFGEFLLAEKGLRMMRRRTFHRTFTATAHRGQPLVDAIEAYRIATGAYPEGLQDLTPVYLPKIPDTGLAGFPEFIYKRTETGHQSGGFMIRIDMPHGFDVDKFMYWPSGKYDEYVERFGKWGYRYD